MSSPNPDVRSAQAVEYIKQALDHLEHTQTQYLHGELQAEGEELGRAVKQLKVLRDKLTGPRSK
jgi:hypothetical protein